MKCTTGPTGARRRRSTRFIEGLEDRRLLAASLVSDINPGTASSDPGQLTRVGDIVYFTTGLNGTSLWKTDGTPAGTVHLRDGRTTILGSFGGKLLFSHEDAASGTEIWTSDGTPQRTVR